jgi:hypothetical protein
MITNRQPAIPTRGCLTQPSTRGSLGSHSWIHRRTVAGMHPGNQASSRPELLAEGVGDSAVTSARRRGVLVLPHRGVVLPRASEDDFVARCHAALSTQDHDACLFGRTAAIALGLPFAPPAWGQLPELVHVAAPREDVTRSARRGLHRHIRLVDASHIHIRQGLRVASPGRTLCDLAVKEPRLLVVQMMDAAVRQQICSLDDLTAALAQFCKLRGVRRQRELVGLARGGVDSPQETKSRLVVVDAGLPEPDLRLEILEDGRLVVRGDLGYRRWLIWIEYDGFDVHSARESFRSDRHRDRWLARRGWEVMRLSDEDVAHPHRFLGQLRVAIKQAPARIAAMPANRSPEVAAARLTLGIDVPIVA